MTPPVTQQDVDAARRAIGLIPGAPRPDTPEHATLVETVAKHHATVSADEFELLYGLRQPRTRAEQLRVDCQCQRMSLDDYERQLRTLVTRPIDEEMLQEFCDACARRIRTYSELLQSVVTIATDQMSDPREEAAHEARITEVAARLTAPFELFKNEMETISRFLVEMQSESGTVVSIRDHAAETAHALALNTCMNAAKYWMDCCAIAARSRDNSEYAYSTTAASLFMANMNHWPRPQELSASISIERVRAELALAAHRAAACSDAVAGGSSPVVGVGRSDATNPAAGGVGWERAMEHAVRIVKTARGMFPGRNELARRVGCSNGTMSKAIERSPYLKARMAEAKAAASASREVPLSDAIADEIQHRSFIESQRGVEGQDELVRLVGEQRADQERDERQRTSARRRS